MESICQLHLIRIYGGSKLFCLCYSLQKLIFIDMNSWWKEPRRSVHIKVAKKLLLPFTNKERAGNFPQVVIAIRRYIAGDLIMVNHCISRQDYF